MELDKLPDPIDEIADPVLRGLLSRIRNRHISMTSSAAAANEPIYNCPICQDSGWVLMGLLSTVTRQPWRFGQARGVWEVVPIPRGMSHPYPYTTAQRCSCPPAQDISALLDQAFPCYTSAPRHELDMYDPERLGEAHAQSGCDALRQVREYIDQWETCRQTGVGLYLYGPSGTGKSHLLIGLAKAIVRRWRITPTYWPLGELVDRLRQTVAEDTGSSAILAPVRETELLLLDEVGGDGRITGYYADVLFRILDYAEISGRPVVIASNYSPPLLAGRLLTGLRGENIAYSAEEAQRTVDRIIGRKLIVRLSGPTQRQPEKKPQWWDGIGNGG